MKRCPHCRHLLGFTAFLTRYSSDTLVKHSANAHPREHVCEHCGRKIWIHYNPLLFKKFIFQNAVLSTVLAALVTAAGVRPLMQLDNAQTVISTVILLMFFMPLAITYAKYQSVVLKEERS